MDYEKYKELDVDVLESLWEGRRRGNFFGVFGSLFEMIGWVALWLPISVFKSTRSRLNVTTVALVVAARVSLASATFPAESGPALSNVGVLKQAVATF